MNQMTTFVLLFAGLGLMFYMFGIGEQNTFSNNLLAILTNPMTISLKSYWKEITVVALSSGLAIYIGVVLKNAELAAMTLILPIVIASLLNFSFVISAVFNESKVIAILVFGPLMYLLSMTLIEYWRGRD